MYKYSLLPIIAASLSIASAANAGSITGELKVGDPREGVSAPTAYKLEYNDTVKNIVNYGVTVEARDAPLAGVLGSEVSAKVGPVLPSISGFQPSVYVEGGKFLSRGNNFGFWGAGVSVSKHVYGPASIRVGYRHREGFNTSELREDRLNGGVDVALTKTETVGVQYYRSRGSINTDAVGLSLTHKF